MKKQISKIVSHKTISTAIFVGFVDHLSKIKSVRQSYKYKKSIAFVPFCYGDKRREIHVE